MGRQRKADQCAKCRHQAAHNNHEMTYKDHLENTFVHKKDRSARDQEDYKNVNAQRTMPCSEQLFLQVSLPVYDLEQLLTTKHKNYPRAKTVSMVAMSQLSPHQNV